MGCRNWWLTAIIGQIGRWLAIYNDLPQFKFTWSKKQMLIKFENSRKCPAMKVETIFRHCICWKELTVDKILWREQKGCPSCDRKRMTRKIRKVSKVRKYKTDIAISKVWLWLAKPQFLPSAELLSIVRKCSKLWASNFARVLDKLSCLKGVCFLLYLSLFAWLIRRRLYSMPARGKEGPAALGMQSNFAIFFLCPKGVERWRHKQAVRWIHIPAQVVFLLTFRQHSTVCMIHEGSGRKIEHQALGCNL